MIGHVVSGQSSHAPDACLAFCCQKKEETQTLAFLKVWLFQGSYTQTLERRLRRE